MQRDPSLITPIFQRKPRRGRMKKSQRTLH